MVLLAPRVTLPLCRDRGGVKRATGDGRLPSEKGQEATASKRDKHMRQKHQPRPLQKKTVTTGAS